MTRLVIVCGNTDFGAELACGALKGAGLVPLDVDPKGLDVAGRDQATSYLARLQAEAMKGAGLNSAEPLPRFWGEQLSSQFVPEACRVLATSDVGQGEAAFLYTPLNAFFIEAWRRVGEQQGIEVRFLIVWRKLFGDQVPARESGGLAKAFNKLAALARAAGPDMYSFGVNDLTGDSTRAAGGLRDVLGRGFAFDIPPVEQLATACREVANGIFGRDRLPDEIVALERIFGSARFGARLFVNERDDEFRLVSDATSRYTSVYAWLNLVERECAEGRGLPGREADEGFDVAEQVQLRACRTELEQQKRAFRIALEESNTRQSRLEAQLEEARSVRQAQQAGGRKSRHATRPQKDAVSRVREERPRVELTLRERRRRKLRNNPHQYFADSKFFPLRPLRFFFRKKGGSAPR